MEPTSMIQSPFAALTLVVAPALLTNASSLLALSTINRMLRTHDRMHALFAESQKNGFSDAQANRILVQASRFEQQAALFLRALHAIYTALAAFASATLVPLLGAGLTPLASGIWARALAIIGIVLGLFGVGGLVFGCMGLSRATQLSLVNIRDEAALIREQQSRKAL